MKITKMLISHNYSKRNSSIKYIVIHDTGNTGKGAGVDNHFKYFNGGNRNASADYFVDDSQIGQFVEDYNKSWHCGDGNGKYGITNDNSIGIEICVNSDGNYEKAVNNTVELVKCLMSKYKISVNNVVRHYDASRKNCPAKIISGYKGITWDKFKSMLGSETQKPSTPPPTQKKLWELSVSGEVVKELQKSIGVKVDGYFGDDTLKKCPLLKLNSKGSTVKAMQRRLNQLGYSTNGIDGIFGNATLTAIKSLQSKAKISVDGIVGNDTWKALYRK